MTSNHHTPIPSSPKQPANAATINDPLSELDEVITDHETRIGELESEFPPAPGNATEFLNGDGEWTVPAGTGASVDGHLIKDEGVSLPQRASIDFVGAGVTVTNEAGGTQVSIPGGGHTIEDEGTPVTQRSSLNFTGTGVTVTDTGGKTKVDIPGGVTDHGALSGLGDDDHTQYHNDARGDARYPRKYAGKTAAPTVNDDSGDGYAVGDKWLDETNDKEYVVLDVTVGAAVWVETTSAGSGGDWASDTAAWTRTGNHTFTVSGDRTSEFRAGITKVRYDDGGGNEYGVVGSSSHSGGTTTVNLIPNSDYAMAGNPTTRAISYLESPVGYPVWFNYTVTWGASGSMTFTSVTPKFTRWRVIGGNTIKVTGRGVGTTGGTASSTLTATLPWNAKHGADNPAAISYVSDTGSGVAGYCYLTADKINSKKYDGSNFGLGINRWVVYDVTYEME